MDQVSKDERLSKLSLFGERSLRRALSEYVRHYHPSEIIKAKATSYSFRRFILRYYHQEAA